MSPSSGPDAQNPLLAVQPATTAQQHVSTYIALFGHNALLQTPRCSSTINNPKGVNMLINLAINLEHKLPF